MTTLTATMPPVSTHISYSQIRAWCDCPLEHYLSRRYQPEFVSSGLRFGSSFHRAAECFYQARLEGRQVKLEELQETFDQTWAIDDETPLKLKEGESQQALKNLSGRMLAVFYKKARPGRVLAVEERLLIELEGDLPPVSVVIDLIEADDEKVSIVDFKTSKAKPTASSVDPEQLLLYALAVRRAGLLNDLGLPLTLQRYYC